MAPNKFELILTKVVDEYRTGSISAQQEWVSHINEIVELCPYRKSSGLVALLFCYLVARSAGVSHPEAQRINLPQESDQRGFSLRGIARSCAGFAFKNGIYIGSSSLDCLNGNLLVNPQTRILDDVTGARNRDGLTKFHQLVKILASGDTEYCYRALLAFVAANVDTETTSTNIESSEWNELLKTLLNLLESNSDYGNVAACIVSSGFSLLTGKPELVEQGKASDPDRSQPCDVTVYHEDRQRIRYAVEVKDKAVQDIDLIQSIRKMRKEGFAPECVVFCLFKGFKGKDIDLVATLESLGVDYIRFDSMMDFMSHIYLAVKMPVDEIIVKFQAEFNKRYSLLVI